MIKATMPSIRSMFFFLEGFQLIGQPPLPYIRPAITTITTPNSVVAVMSAPLLL
jgi:hypothetical protein